MRIHVQIPGRGDVYHWNGSALTVNGTPIAEVENPPDPRAKYLAAPRARVEAVAPDAALERERAQIGAVILGWLSPEGACVVDPHHVRIVAALTEVPIVGPDRIGSAIRVCLTAGIDPVLCGSTAPGSACRVGYLAGCARAARQRGEVFFSPDVDDAEAWER